MNYLITSIVAFIGVVIYYKSSLAKRERQSRERAGLKSGSPGLFIKHSLKEKKRK